MSRSERRASGRRRLLLAVTLPLVGLAIQGCATGGLLPVQSKGLDPWEVSEDAYPSQRLYRVSYDGPEGDVSFRLTLYLQESEIYRMEASDLLGRKVWSLGVGGGPSPDEAIWLDHRNDEYCRVLGVRDQAFVPIAYLPLVRLPRFILGRMPGEPFVDLRQAEGRFSFVDRGGQTWSGETGADGILDWWTLVQVGEPVAWLRRVEDEWVFSDRRGGQQVRWREQIREPLHGPLTALDVPPKYRQGDCGGRVEDRPLVDTFGDPPTVEDVTQPLTRGAGGGS